VNYLAKASEKHEPEKGAGKGDSVNYLAKVSGKHAVPFLAPCPFFGAGKGDSVNYLAKVSGKHAVPFLAPCPFFVSPQERPCGEYREQVNRGSPHRVRPAPGVGRTR
jgi:hypothetical protein